MTTHCKRRARRARREGDRADLLNQFILWGLGGVALGSGNRDAPRRGERPETGQQDWWRYFLGENAGSAAFVSTGGMNRQAGPGMPAVMPYRSDLG